MVVQAIGLHGFAIEANSNPFRAWDRAILGQERLPAVVVCDSGGSREPIGGRGRATDPA